MLATEKISKAFQAIIDEAEKLHPDTPAEEAVAIGKAIVSIAKHQSDIRGAVPSGKCKARNKNL